VRIKASCEDERSHGPLGCLRSVNAPTDGALFAGRAGRELAVHLRATGYRPQWLSRPGHSPSSPGGFEAEWRQAFRNLEAILNDAGSGLEHIVKTTTFLADLDDGEVANRLYAEFFPTSPPARSSPVVVLPRGLLLSVEAIAVVP
jgi:hypothetical protein